MAVTLEQSYGYCRQVARTRAKNFYYSFLLLDQAQRNAMCAIYAFNRHCDDLSDEPAPGGAREVREKIANWRLQLHHALAGQVDENQLWPAFHDTVQRYNIPHRFFDEMID